MQGQLPDFSKFLPALQAQADGFGDAVVSLLQAGAPVSATGHDGRSPGTFRDSLRGTVKPLPDGVEVTVNSDDVPVANWILHGTRPHEISARHTYRTSTGKEFPGYLVFDVQGSTVFVHHSKQPIHHPGTAPNPFADDAQPAIEAAAEAMVEAAVQEAFGA